MKRPRCPICGKVVDPAHRPFCSRRCSQVDLQRWLTGRYVLSPEPDETATDENEPPRDEEE